MVRPKEYEEGSRIHMGTRFDKHLVALFDELARRQRLTRTQALEWCVSDAIKQGRIPMFAQEVTALIEAQKLRMATPKAPLKKKSILVAGRPGGEKLEGSGDDRKQIVKESAQIE